MKASTILKAVVAVTAVCTASAVACTKIKEIENKKSETPVDSDDNKTNNAELTLKEVTVITALGTVSGTVIGLVTLKYLPVVMYKGAVCTLAERAIKNGSLTFDQLFELSKKATKERGDVA